MEYFKVREGGGGGGVDKNDLSKVKIKIFIF